MYSYFLKILSVIFIFVIFFSCSKNTTEHGKENIIIEPEILYISEAYYPIHKTTLTLIDANGNNRREIFSISRGYILYPIFSNDGKSIIFLMTVDSADIGTAIYKIDGNGKNLLKISESHLDYNYTPYDNPQLLQDEINIIYIKRVDLQDYEIRNLNIETKEDKLLVSGYFYGLYPEITADDEWIIFWENGDLYKKRITGGEKYKITDGNAYAERFHLNKMTNEIVFRSYNSQIPSEMNIAKINLDGSNYMKYNFSGQNPKISNDGAHILFLAMGNNKPSIWISNSDGSNTRIVASNYTWDDFVQFFPSSERILFVRENTDRALFSCGINGEDLKQLTPFDHYAGNCPQFKP